MNPHVPGRILMTAAGRAVIVDSLKTQRRRFYLLLLADSIRWSIPAFIDGLLTTSLLDVEQHDLETALRGRKTSK